MQPQEISHKRQCLQGKDRLSQLPDHVLHHILNYLNSINESARTSLLSRRWLNLWVSMPDLFFDNKSAKTTTDFINSVNRVLLLREPSSNLQSFQLRWHGYDCNYDQGICNMWVRHVLMRNVKLLLLDVNTSIQFSKLKVDYLESIFACQSLEFLSIKYQNPVFISAGMPSRLARLKKMTLEYFIFEPGALRNLISGCTVLEELVLDTCVFQDTEITSLTLKKLVVRNCYVSGALQVLSPKIQTFHYVGNKGSGKFKIAHVEVVTEESSGSANADDKMALEEWFFSQIGGRVN